MRQSARTKATQDAGQGELVREIRVGRLDSVAAWRKEIGRVYRAMRRGEIAHDIGTKLTYVANVAAQLVQVEEQIRNQDRIIEELQRRPGMVTAPTPLLPLQQPAEDGNGRSA
ncbi:MAG: hypothetical protein ABI859_16525 [Pseudomonadota bacterium]